MHNVLGERVSIRIYVSEQDKFEGEPLHVAIVETLRRRGCAGATVYRAMMGYGRSARVHTDRLEVLSLDLPIIIECVETEERIDAVLPELHRMIDSGLLTRQTVNAIEFRSR